MLTVPITVNREDDGLRAINVASACFGWSLELFARFVGEDLTAIIDQMECDLTKRDMAAD